MRMRHAAVVAGLALGLMSGAAKAAVIITIQQDGANVVATGSGSIDLSAVEFNSTSTLTPGIRGNTYYFGSGGSDDPLNAYGDFSGPGPSSFGPGTSLIAPSSSTGDDFAFGYLNPQLYLSQSYVSRSQLTFSAIFQDQTLNSLGLADGSYMYVSTNGESLDTVTFNIGNVSAVPLPSSAPMFGAALLALGAVGYGVKRKKAAAAA